MPTSDLLKSGGARIAWVVVKAAALSGRSCVFVCLCVIEGVLGIVLLLLLRIQNT